MQTTKNVCLVLVSLFLLVAVACRQKQQGQSPDDKLPIDVKIVEKTGGGGWEYDIYVDHKLYIKQDRIPAVAGIQGFASKADAEKTAKAVVERIKKGLMPALSVEDLKALQIQLPQ
jgi:hypothetical protein